MKILITGASGLLGSAISKFASPNLHQILTPRHMDLNLNDESATYNYIKNHMPDTIIHCAAKVGGISANIENQNEFLTENIQIDSSLLNAAKQLEIRNLIYLGSSCMYPRNISHAMRESELLTGTLEPTNEGYALAKIVGWKTVEYNSSSLNWRTMILSNLYGPNDHFSPSRSHLLAAIIEKMYSAKTNNVEYVDMWGDGSVRREFTYVQDVAEFLTNSVEKLKDYPATMNLGAGIDFSVADYYGMVAAAMKYEGQIRVDLSKPTGMSRKLMDSSIAVKFGWAPKTNMELGIAKTISWYEKNLRTPTI